ncbi:MAG: response regulator [Bacteroidota bacterium]|nr:response regulator [Bacteroidota bacterium]
MAQFAGIKNHGKSVILIVDDLSANLKLVGTILKKEGYEVLTAMHATQAISIAINKLPDLILLDITMPDINGFEICKKLKAEDVTKNIPVIFLTASTDKSDIRKGFETGGVDYLTKPFDRIELLARIKNHVELKKSREKIIKDSEYKASILANTSHEIKTPLNAIIGISEILSGLENLNTGREHIKSLSEAASILLKLVNDMLDLSKIQAGKAVLNMKKFSLNKLLQSTVTTMQYVADKKKLPLFLEIDNEIANWYESDSSKINQVILNLLSNAIKFTDSGNVTLACKVIKPGKKNDLVCITVTDTGKGIDEQFLPYLFDSYSQELSTVKYYEGTGIGLTIAKQIVQLLEGEIKVENKPTKGTVFTVELPLKKTNKSGTTESSITIENSAEELLKGEKILVVEDNQLNQVVITAMLEELGMEIEIAESGIIAIEKIKVQTYRFILMDINMPGMDGFEAAGIIRNQYKLNTIIIALTAMDSDKQLKNCFKAGMNAYVPKPIDSALLRNVLVEEYMKNPNTPLFSTDKNANAKKPTPEKTFNIQKAIDLSNGNTNLLNGWIKEFVETLQSAEEEINYFISRGVYFTQSDHLHSLAGSALYFGAVNLQKEIKSFNSYINNNPGRKPEAVILLKNIMVEITTIRNYMAKL